MSKLDVYENIIHNNNEIFFRCQKTYKEPNVQCFLYHWHEEIEVILIEDGTLYLNLSGIDIIAEKNDIIFINPRIRHIAFTKDNPCTYYFFNISKECFSENLHTSLKYLNVFFNPSILQNKFQNNNIKSILLNLYDEYTNKRDMYNLMIKSYLYAAFCEIHRQNIFSEPINSHPIAFDIVLDYITHNFHENISLDDISKLYSYEKTYFCHKFLQQTGTTFTQYLRDIRMNAASKMLTHSSLSISDIASQVGYSNSNYFTKHFTTHFNMSPREYRLKHIKKGL